MSIIYRLLPKAIPVLWFEHAALPVHDLQADGPR